MAMKKANIHAKEQSGLNLIKYRVKKNRPSKILNDFQFSNLAGKMTSLYRGLNWQLIYRMSDSGISMNTFLNACQSFDTTVTVIEDANGYKFGGFNLEPWRVGSKFYGCGESFVYTFKDTD